MMMNIYENNDMRCIQYVTDDDDEDDEDDAEDDEGGVFEYRCMGDRGSL